MIDRGDLFKTSAGALYRLLEVTVSRGKKVAHVFGMDDPKALPQQWKFSDLVDGLKAGEYTRLSDRRIAVVVKARDDAPTDEQESPSDELGRERWRLIGPLAKNQDIYIRKRRGSLVAGRAKEMNVSAQRLLDCLRLYWRGGMTKVALRGNYERCGVPGEGATEQSSRGRLPRNERYEKFLWTEAAKKKVTAVATRFFRKKKTNTRYFVYRQVIGSLYSVIDANGKKVPLPLGERPTKAQVLYLLDKQLTLETVLKRKLGEDNFENDVAPKTGSARLYANGIGQYYEIDSTIPDILICDEHDRSVVIGKATLYLVVDVFSRLIVGFHLTLEAPSWSSALEALVSVVADKKALCERWGVEYDPDDWPAHGYWPAAFRADRGPEMTSHYSDAVADHLETTFVNVPRRKATRKSTVECMFKLVHVPIKDHVSGYTPPADIGRRQTDDQKSAATRTFKSVGREILESVRLHNNKVHKGIELPARDVYQGVQPIPKVLWRRDHEERMGELPRFGEEHVRFNLLPRSSDFTVTSRGVFFEGLLWVPEKAQERKWLLPAASGVYKVTATYHRNLVDRIYVHDPKDPSKWTEMHLSDLSIEHTGRSFAEVALLKERRLTLKELADEHNLALHVAHDAEASAREAQEHAATQEDIYRAGGRSRTKDSVPKRAAAVQQSRSRTPGLSSKPASSGAQKAKPVAVEPLIISSMPEPVSASRYSASQDEALDFLLSLQSNS